MKTKFSRSLGLTLVAGIWAFTSACTSINSGNLGHDVKPLPYKVGEEATVITRTSRMDPNTKKMVTVIEEVSDSGLEVNKKIQLRKLETARDVGVARAVSGNDGATRGFWSSLFGGGNANYYGGNGGGYYGGNHYNGGGTQGSFTPYGGTSGNGGGTQGSFTPYGGTSWR